MIMTPKTIATCSLTLAACALCIVFIVSVNGTMERPAQVAQADAPRVELSNARYTQGIRLGEGFEAR